MVTPYLGLFYLRQDKLYIYLFFYKASRSLNHALNYRIMNLVTDATP